MMMKEEYKVKFEFTNGVDTFAYDDLSPGEILTLTGLLWQFINKNIKVKKLKSFNTHVIFLLDVPDSYLEQNTIDDYIKIIENDLVKGLQFRVILTSHIDILTPNLFKEKNILALESYNRNDQTFTLSQPKFTRCEKFLRSVLYLSFTSLKKLEKKNKDWPTSNKRSHDECSNSESSPNKILKK